jgi:carboxymethylenebutenolidase
MDADDMAFSNQLQRDAEMAFSERKYQPNFVEYEFHEYKGLPHCNRIPRLDIVLKQCLTGTTHGFAARPNLSIPDVKAGFEGAFKSTVNWFNKHLTV